MNNNPVRYNDPTGHCIDGISTAFCIAVLAGGIVGGIASGAGYVAAQKLAGQEIDYQDLGVAILGGVVVGALSPVIAVTASAGAAIAGTLALNGIVTSGQYVASQSLHGEQVDPITAVGEFGVGVVAGTIGGTYTPFDDLGREGMSAGLKIGMDFSEVTLTKFEKEMAHQFLDHTVTSTGVVNFVRTFGATVTQPYTRKMWDTLLYGDSER